MFDIIVKHLNGRLAQLGEHLPYKQRVTGSSPVLSTRKVNEKKSRTFFQEGFSFCKELREEFGLSEWLGSSVG